MSKQPSKISVILQSLKEDKAKYIKIADPKNGNDVMYLKLVLEFEEYEDYLNAFFDEGLLVKSCTKEEFEEFKSDDILGFTIDD